MNYLGFRIWDKKLKKFLDTDNSDNIYAISPNGDLTTYHIEDGKLQSYVDDNLEAHRKAVKKDYKGKDIFACDIIKETYVPNTKQQRRPSYGIIVLDPYTNNMFIEWHSQRSYEGEKYWDTQRLSLRNLDDYELVGNIYENPELAPTDI